MSREWVVGLVLVVLVFAWWRWLEGDGELEEPPTGGGDRSLEEPRRSAERK